MSAAVLDGRALAYRLRGEVAARTGRLLDTTGVVPGLAAVLVGDDPASATYVRSKARACAEVGIRSEVVRLPASTTQTALLETVARLNADAAVHGILVQLPLPSPLDAAAITRAVDPDKDVDGFHPVNVGRLALGDRTQGFLPATPSGVLRLLIDAGIPLAGAEAVVVGRSDIVGKPTALLLLQADATVTICHSRTADLAAVTRRADILVVAVGRPGTITAAMVKPGAAVVDVGTNRIVDAAAPRGSRLIGDVDPGVADVAGWLTPVPGGVGPMTIALLLENTLLSAQRAAGVA